MLKSSNKTDVNTTELVITVDAATFENAVEQEFQRQRKNIQIKGFRKGKAPRKLVEKEYGEGAFYEGAINNLLGPEIDAAVAETNLVLVDRPNVEVTSIDKENGVELKVVCVTKPEIEISDYKGIKAPKEVKAITDEDIDKQIEMIRKKNARIVSVEDRPAQMDDEVVIDFEGFFGDEPFEGGKGEDHPLKLGSGQFIPGFEDQIVGHNIGDEFDVVVSFPEDYHMADYAGKEATFKTKVKASAMRSSPRSTTISSRMLQSSIQLTSTELTSRQSSKRLLFHRLTQHSRTLFSMRSSLRSTLLSRIVCTSRESILLFAPSTSSSSSRA